jgi:hypothetical protein
VISSRCRGVKAYQLGRKTDTDYCGSVLLLILKCFINKINKRDIPNNKKCSFLTLNFFNTRFKFGKNFRLFILSVDGIIKKYL